MAKYDFVSGDAMPTLSPKCKQRPAQFKTSALESARRAGFAGVFAGAPDLAANCKKYLKGISNSDFKPQDYEVK